MSRNRLQNYIHQEFEVSIQSLTARGWGQGSFVDNNRTIQVEVRGALPGDIVRAEGRHIENSMVQSRIVQFIRQAYPRIPIGCPHAGPRCDKDTGCGGCTLRDCAYETQCRLKEDILRNALKKSDVDFEISPIVPCESQFYYRNKVELSFGPDGAAELGVGLHPAGFKHEVIAMKYCDMLAQVLPEIAIQSTRWAKSLGIPEYTFKTNEGFLRLLTLREGKRTGATMLILTTSCLAEVETANGPMQPQAVVERFIQDVVQHLSRKIDTFYWTIVHAEKGQPTRLEDRLMFGPPVLRETMFMPDEKSALHYEVLPRAFFQPNTIQAEKLYQIVLQQAEPFMKPDTPMLDLYCGTGTIGLSFARHGHRVIAIDIEKQAIDNARKNAVQNGLENDVEFYAGDTAEILKSLLDNNANFSDFLLVVDPPRRGLLPPAYKQIMRLNLNTIIYVSCNPESLAMDIKRFKDDGYEILNIQPVDMLPQTAHLETVATLHKS